MVVWKELMFQTTVTTADVETALTPWTPTKSAKMIGVEIVVGYQAATSLVESGYIKMSCPTFGGVDAYFGFCGLGVGTAPREYIPPIKHVCDLDVQAGTPVKGFIYLNVTATTPEIFVYGIFQA
jgi:hypothetical protein